MTSVFELSNSLDGGNEPFYDFLCTLCNGEEKHVEATKYCKECFVYMCDRCVQNHARFPLNKRHTLVDEAQFIEDKQAPLVSFPTKRCASHPGELINIYCQHHDIVCCSVCKVLEHGSCSKLQHLPDAAIGIKTSEMHQHITKDTETFILKLGKLLRARKTDLSRINKEKQTAYRTIVDFRKRIKDVFDDLEKKSIDILNENVSRKISEIDLHTEYLENNREVAGDILRQLKSFEGDNECELFYLVKEGKKMINDSKEKVTEMSEMLQRECIRYEIDAEIEKIVSSLSALGSITDHKMPKSDTESTDTYLSASRNTSVSQRNDMTSTDQSTDFFDSYASSQECSVKTLDCPIAVTSDMKSEESSQTQETESHFHIGASDTTVASCSYSTTSSYTSSSLYLHFNPSVDSDIYENVSNIKVTRSDNTQSSGIMGFESVTSSDNCCTPSRLSLCSDTDSNTEQPSMFSNIYDSLPSHIPSHIPVSPKTETATSSPSELAFSNEEISSAFTIYSSGVITSSSTSSDIIAKSSENVETTIAESGSTISACHVQSSSELSSDTLDKSCKDMFAPCSVDTPEEASTQTYPLQTISEHSNTRHIKVCTMCKPVPMMRFNVKEKSDHHDCNIFDICHSLDGMILLIDDRNHKLKRVDQSYKLHDSIRLPADPYSVCAAGPGLVAVSLRNNKKIQFVHVGKKLKLAKSFTVGNNCRGMVYIDGYLNVCTGDLTYPFSGRIEVYNNTGQLQYCIPRAPKRLPSVLKYIVVEKEGHHRFVTMYSSDSITMLDAAGYFVESFSHKDLKQPEGICTDSRGQVFVCGFHSNNVIQLSPKQQRIEEVLDETDGIKKPIAIYYEELNSRLLVSCSYSNEVLIFTLK